VLASWPSYPGKSKVTRVRGGGKVAAEQPLQGLLEAGGLVVWMQSPASFFQLPACKEAKK